MKTQSDEVLEVANWCLVQLKGVMGNNGHVLLRSDGLHHVERGAKPKLLRRVTFDDGAHNDKWCTKRVDGGFGLEGEPRPKSYVEVVIGTPRKVPFDDDVRFGLEGEIVRARPKSHFCEGSSECRGVGATKNNEKARSDDDYLSKNDVVGCCEERVDMWSKQARSSQTTIEGQ